MESKDEYVSLPVTTQIGEVGGSVAGELKLRKDLFNSYKSESWCLFPVLEMDGEEVVNIVSVCVMKQEDILKSFLKNNEK